MNIENYITALTRIEEIIHTANNALNQILGALTAERDLRSDNTNKGGATIIENSALIPANNKKIPDVRKIENKEQEKMPKLKHIYIYKREKYYYVQVHFKGLKKSFTRKNKNSAIKDAKECLEDFMNHSNPTSLSTLHNIATFYLENLKKPFVSDIYYYTLTSKYNKHIKEKIGNLRINSINAITLQGYFEELTKYSTRVAEDVKTFLNQVFEYAVGNQLIKVNPMRAVKVLRHVRENGQALSKEQIANLKGTIKGTKYEIPFLILLYTGVRGSELKSLQFDFNKNTVIIKNSKLKSYQKEKTREIPIMPGLFPFQEEIMKEEWKTVCIKDIEKKYGEFVKIGRLNWLRHTFQTYCTLVAGNELVNYWAGHNLGNNMTAKVYTHFPMDYQQQIASNILY